MTDTPRTRAELLTLFATNTSQDISAQDMRDLVVSITNPTPVDGLARNVSANTFVATRFKSGGLVDGMYDTYTKAAVTTLPPQNDRVFDWRGTSADTNHALVDPAGWLNGTPISDSGWWGTGSYPVGTVLEIPAGMYAWQTQALVASPLTTGAFYIYIDRITNPATTGTPLMQAVPSFGNGGGAEDNMTSFLSTFTGFYVCDEPTQIIPDLFGSAEMNTAKSIAWVQMNLVRIA